MSLVSKLMEETDGEDSKWLSIGGGVRRTGGLGSSEEELPIGIDGAL